MNEKVKNGVNKTYWYEQMQTLRNNNMKFKPYPKYKDSRIDWIGEIPEGWEVRKIKHICNTVAGGTPSTVNLEYWDGDIPWLPSGMVHNNIIGTGDVFKFITLEGLNNSSTKKIRKDSPLIALTGATCGNIAYLTFEATANQSVVGMETNKKSNAKYLYYYLISQREQILINKTGGAQSGINEQNVKDIFCSYPSLTEQTAISNFLDKKIAKTDVLIEKDKRLIELLKEKRTVLINNAVTKGLDPNVKLKDSGIEWIGKIPEGWKVRRLKFMLDNKENSIKTGPFGSQLTIDEMYDSEYKVYNQKNVIKKDEKLGENYVSSEKFKELIAFKTSPSDLLITTRGTIGKTLRLSEKAEIGILHPCLMKINNNKEMILDRYMELIIEDSDLVRIQLQLQSCATTIDVIYQNNLKEIKLFIPPINEQRTIIEYLDRQTLKIDKIIQKIEQKINILEEYKKSLIHHAVTGKIDIREVKI